MAEFFDQLVTLCGPEMNAAMKDGDLDRAGAVIEGLATMLGRSIARAAGGDTREIDKMLTACEQHVAAEAAGIAGVMNLAKALRAHRG
ncbi:hypothetical protein SAMN05421641_10769 [Paracoccus thiocyanatus]|uniref:Uncharacterized protein n=1 Tax=Paracoccus thiocyanatus TaxID=34006 RepID=A0A1N6SDL5_9RHOB|nr:hypothetical protein [Paracoccus thiocyanatus]SIQ39161.1 hypothetical protein SAMN05421641_10769 [Paracoccus thiocyanatus]